MSVLAKFASIIGLVVLAFSVSGFFYARSRSADFDRHAEAIGAIGRVRHLDERLTELVLAARFGLLNQYDPITATELELADASSDVRNGVGEVVSPDGSLGEALRASSLYRRHHRSPQRRQAV